ncbi:MAG: flagellar hook-length control protein FliK, partial [Spirochaetota bacterium]
AEEGQVQEKRQYPEIAQVQEPGSPEKTDTSEEASVVFKREKREENGDRVGNSVSAEGPNAIKAPSKAQAVPAELVSERGTTKEPRESLPAQQDAADADGPPPLKVQVIDERKATKELAPQDERKLEKLSSDKSAADPVSRSPELAPAKNSRKLNPLQKKDAPQPRNEGGENRVVSYDPKGGHGGEGVPREARSKIFQGIGEEHSEKQLEERLEERLGKANELFSDTTESEESPRKVRGEGLRLRSRQNEGIEQLGNKENSQLANQQHGKQQNHSEFSRDFGESSEVGITDVRGQRLDTPFSNAGANGGAMRSLAQQMIQRFQEGPLAQNLRQLQFRLLDQNRGEIRLRLHPENLGRVSIHLNIDGNLLRGRFVAENAEVARMLQDNMEHLASGLREGGFENQGLDVSVGEESRGFSGGSPRNSSRFTVDSEDWEDPVWLQEQSQIDFSA